MQSPKIDSTVVADRISKSVSEYFGDQAPKLKIVKELSAKATASSKTIKIRENAYAPYSNFKVGAAIKSETGDVFCGCNVENAAYPQGTCAEAGAIAVSYTHLTLPTNREV